jgi:formyl-CoA transferase/CoA:oxalate CoA-transferase
MILGDLGADVIKIERPGVGDQSRRWGPPFVGTESAYFLSVNRNKRSVALDIKSDAGREQLAHLLATADVFVCNVPRVDSLREAGLLPEPLLARNPRLIYCSITAYGRTGPYAGRTGYDLVAQGEAGLMAATGDVDGSPMRWPVAAADLSSGLWSALSILAALHARAETGRGQVIDQSLLEGQLSWAPVMATQHLASGRRPAKLGNRHANIVPYELFQAQDKHVIVAVGTEGQWHRLCEALGLGSAVRDDQRFATNADRVRNRAELKLLLDSVFGRRPADYWLGVLRAAGIPSGPVNALDEALNDPQVRHRRMVVEFEHPMGTVRALGNPIHLSETPVTYRRRPPLLGEHTAEVLEASGFRGVEGPATVGAGMERTLRRPPRYPAAVPLRIAFEGAFAAGATFNVSDGGCAVRVSGLRPSVGDEVTLVTTGPRVGLVARAVVRWTQPDSGTERRVGLRVHSDWQDDPAWRALVAEIVGSGAGAP